MFVTESLLAFTIFRDEFDIPFAIMFGFLLFVKCFHWLMSDRMESASGFRSGACFRGSLTLFLDGPDTISGSGCSVSR